MVRPPSIFAATKQPMLLASDRMITSDVLSHLSSISLLSSCSTLPCLFHLSFLPTSSCKHGEARTCDRHRSQCLVSYDRGECGRLRWRLQGDATDVGGWGFQGVSRGQKEDVLAICEFITKHHARLLLLTQCAKQPIGKVPGRYALRCSETTTRKQFAVCYRPSESVENRRTRACLRNSDGSDGQQWDVALWGKNDTYRFINVHNGSKYHLDVIPNGPVYMSPNLDGYQRRQRWLMTSVSNVDDAAYSTVFSNASRIYRLHHQSLTMPRLLSQLPIQQRQQATPATKRANPIQILAALTTVAFRAVPSRVLSLEQCLVFLRLRLWHSSSGDGENGRPRELPHPPKLHRTLSRPMVISQKHPHRRRSTSYRITKTRPSCPQIIDQRSDSGH